MNMIQSGLQPVSSSREIKTPGVMIWFGVSFIAPLYFGLISFFHAVSSNYLVQDDARLHIVWLQRLRDPALFTTDTIADYYEAIQPAGFRLLYRLAAALGFEPTAVAQSLPLVLAIICTGYLFWVAVMILPVPMSGLLTTLILNQNFWVKDDLISAAPRAFVYPLFSAFLYYTLKGSTLACLVSLGLLGLFYPQMMLVALGILTLRLIQWRGRWPTLPRRWQPYATWLAALALTVGLLFAFAHYVDNQVGQLTSLGAMKMMPEFQLHGRGEYFGVSFLSFWFDGASGLRLPLFPPILWLGVLLPVTVWYSWPRFELARYLTAQVAIVGQLLVSAMGLFLLAHGIFPTLYLPSRYTYYSNRFMLAIASGVMVTLVLHRWWQWLIQQLPRISSWTATMAAKVGLSSLFAIAVIITPAIPALFLGSQGWVEGHTPAIYQTLAKLPKDSLVASLVTEVNDNVPAFSQRSVLVGREFALPYHTDFYNMMSQRMGDLVNAQYSPELASVQAFIQTYGLDVWIVAQEFADPAYLDRQTWLLHSSAQDSVIQAKTSLQQGIQPALTQILPVCSLLTEANLIVMDAHCILKITEP